jgi:quercetin dioxygenase-like cupin family protein
MSDIITFVVTGEETDGAFSLVEIQVPPGGGPPPLHTHPVHESFCVIEGDVCVFQEDPEGKVVKKEPDPGTVVHVRSGVPHTFRNLSGRPARVWAVFAPAAMMEAFFTQAGVPHDPSGGGTVAGADEIGRVMQVGERLGMRLLQPPPGVAA